MKSRVLGQYRGLVPDPRKPTRGTALIKVSAADFWDGRLNSSDARPLGSDQLPLRDTGMTVQLNQSVVGLGSTRWSDGLAALSLRRSSELDESFLNARRSAAIDGPRHAP